MLTTKLRWTASLALLGLAAFVTGCGGGDDATPSGTTDAGGTTPVAAAPDGDDHDKNEEGGGHDGWWCVEHGVPEAECPRCDSSLIAQFKDEGDWCKEHDRPESQCFICSPKRSDKLAARYEAKFGKKPPAPTE